MSLGVLNNLSAMYAENNLNNTSNSLNTVLQQLSSGSKINSGADDAAGLSLVNGLQANSVALAQSQTNAAEGVGLLKVADGALSQVTNLLNRAVTLATEASNGTLNSSQDTAANQEYQSILAEINNIGSTTTYNGRAVFGTVTNIYTGDSSTTGSSINALNIGSLSSSNVGDTGGVISYSNGSNNVFLNLSTGSKNAAVSDSLGGSNSTITVNYLVKGSNGASSTATTAITVGSGTSYANNANGLISAINNAGLGLTATFATQTQAGVAGGGSQTGIEITGGLISAGVAPNASSTSGTLTAGNLVSGVNLTQGQTIAVSLGGTQKASVTIGETNDTLSQLASAIQTQSANTITATVVTNNDGTQSLSLADATNSGGALTVSASGGSNPVAAFSGSGTGSVATATSDLQHSSVSQTGVLGVTGVAGSQTVGVSSTGADNSFTGSIALTYTPTSGSAVTETFVMGGSGGSDGGGTGAYDSSTNTFTVNGNSLDALKAAINSQTASEGMLGITAGSIGTTGMNLSGAAGTVTATDSLVNTSTLTGASVNSTTATGATAGTLDLNAGGMNASTDVLAAGSKISVQDGTGTAKTFIVGADPGGGPANTYYTGASSNTLGDMAALIQSTFGSSAVTASAGANGLTISSTTNGNDITITGNSLVNANATLGLYNPTLSGGTTYATGLLALTNSDGTAITGNIGASDTLSGSFSITNNGVTDTFVMGLGANGGSGLDGATASTSGSNTIYVGTYSAADLATAISGASTLTGDSLDLTAVSDAASGGIYLQASDQGITDLAITGSTLAVGQSGNNAIASTSGVVAVTGINESIVVGAGTSSTAATGVIPSSSDLLTGSITLANANFNNGAGVAQKFVMGGTGQGIGSYDASTHTYTVNGNSMANLAAAINDDATNLGLNAVAGTAGLQLTSLTSGSGAITASSNSLVDTSVGSNSQITLGSFASQNDAVSGTLDLSLGGVQKTALTLTAGSTVGSMIDQINNSSLGVTAKWVADGNNSFGSVQLTSNTPGTGGNITAATSTVTDTTATATLSYTAASAYNVGVSGSIYDATSGQSAPVNSTANFTPDVKASSGIATISYTDGGGQSLSATDLSNQSDAQSALTALNAAIINVAAQDGYIGAQINTLNAVSSVLSTQQQNVVSAQNAVQATDYATAASNMSKYEILSQTGISALAQANSMQQEVTKLLQ